MSGNKYSDFTQAFDYAIFYSGDASVNSQFEEAPSDIGFALGGSKQQSSIASLRSTASIT